MSPIEIAAYTTDDSAALEDLLADPAILSEYAPLVESGEFRKPLDHPSLHPGGFWLARDGGTVAGFGMLLVMQSVKGLWAYLRLGVRGAHRRRGIGSLLLARAIESLSTLTGENAVTSVTSGAWIPAPEAESFLEHRGFRMFRTWWNMERAIGPVPVSSGS